MLTYLPVQSIIHNADLSRRMPQRAIELSEFDIQYKPRLAKKGQVIVDFIVKIPQSEMSQGNLNWWTLSVNGASRQTGAGIGLQLKSLVGEKIEQAIRLGFNAYNNESKYEAILAGIELAAIMSTEKLLIRNDSQLVVGQVNEE